MSEIIIPEGYVAEDINDDFREMGMSEEAIAEMNADIEEQVKQLIREAANVPVPPETQRLIDIIESPDTTWEEKRRHAVSLTLICMTRTEILFLTTASFMTA